MEQEQTKRCTLYATLILSHDRRLTAGSGGRCCGS